MKQYDIGYIKGLVDSLRVSVASGFSFNEAGFIFILNSLDGISAQLEEIEDNEKIE